MFVDRATFRRLLAARDRLADAHTDAPLATIARDARLSPSHFIRAFDAIFGTTPHQFRTTHRLARARALLARGDSVTDTCFALGFSSLGSFSALFQRRVGVAPSRYRRSVQVDLPRGPRHCFELMAYAARVG